MRAQTKLTLSCTIGTFLEFFDYTLYGYFASTIGHLFFPSENHHVQLLATWGIFAIGFLVRPLGALIFGHIADKCGRCKVLPITILLMALPTISIGLLPTFETIGWWAPVLLLLCRMVQGLALSGEYNAYSIFVLENHWQRAGFLGSLTPFSCGLGFLSAAFLAYLFTSQGGELSQWQWRPPFILAGLLVGVLGGYLRSNLIETISFQQLLKDENILPLPIKQVFAQNKIAILTNICCSAYMGSASYLLLVYISTYLNQQFNVPMSAALLIASIAALVEALCCVIFGWISDQMGRWQTMLLASFSAFCVAMVFVAFPHLNTTTFAVGLMALVVLLGAFDGPLTMYLPELFDTASRYSGTTIGYNLGGAVLGGLAPFMVTLILQKIPKPQWVLGFYLGGFAIFACLSIFTHVFLVKKQQETAADPFMV